MVLCDPLELTDVEKLKLLDRKLAPGRSDDVTSLAVFVVSCAQVPLFIVLVSDGVNLHS